MRSLSRRTHAGGNRRLFGLLTALAALVVACGGSDTEAGPAPSLPPECTPVRSPEILPATHIPDGQTATYNSTPPSSGNHYSRPARAGGYSEPIKNETQVHNLEHGHVMVQHRGLTDAQVDALERIVREDPAMILMAPYPDMDAVVAFTSWGKIQTCDAWSEAVPALARYFIRTNRDNAPESLP